MIKKIMIREMKIMIREMKIMISEGREKRRKPRNTPLNLEKTPETLKTEIPRLVETMIK